MNLRTPLLNLAFIGLVACGSNGGVDSIYGNLVGPTILDGTWIQQRLLCDGTEVAANPGESTAMTIAGRQVVISNSFDNAGSNCEVRTAGTVIYEEANTESNPSTQPMVTFKLGNPACGNGCDPAMCAVLRGRIVPPMVMHYELIEPRLTMSTNEGSTLGCQAGRPTVVEFDRQ